MPRTEGIGSEELRLLSAVTPKGEMFYQGTAQALADKFIVFWRLRRGVPPAAGTNPRRSPDAATTLLPVHAPCTRRIRSTIS